MGLRVDRLVGVERIPQAVGLGRARHELRDALGPRRRVGEGIEVRLCIDLGRQQRRADVPALRGTRDRLPEAVGHERRDRAATVTVRPGAAGAAEAHRRRPRIPRVAVVLWLFFTMYYPHLWTPLTSSRWQGSCGSATWAIARRAPPMSTPIASRSRTSPPRPSGCAS